MSDQVLIYGDSLSWGVIPNTRKRFRFSERWPGVMERDLATSGCSVRVIEDCLNGRRTVWDDPYKAGRNGLVGIEQRIEINSPLILVILMLGTNDFQSMHHNTAWESAQGMATLIRAIRRAPVEPDIVIPDILVVAPPPIRIPKGPVLPKFRGAEERCVGIGDAFARVAKENRCYFFDAASVITTSDADGVHLDLEQHSVLGRALARHVAEILSE